MSMLSGQIDELRLMGDGQAAKGEFTVATLLREAADTIESLREKLQRGTCELAYGEDDEGYDGWYCQSCGGWFDAARRDGRLVRPTRCGCCGRMVER